MAVDVRLASSAGVLNLRAFEFGLEHYLFLFFGAFSIVVLVENSDVSDGYRLLGWIMMVMRAGILNMQNMA